MEILLATPAVRNMIRESKTHQMQSVIQTSAGVGMQTMDQHLRELYQRNTITYDDAMARAMNPDELKRLLTTTPRPGQPSQ
jgi:twitching motility protein PilT